MIPMSEKPTIACRVCGGLGRTRNDRYYGGLMRAKRLATGLSLRKVAATMKSSASYLSDLETGRRHVSDATMQRIEDAITVAKGKQ